MAGGLGFGPNAPEGTIGLAGRGGTPVRLYHPLPRINLRARHHLVAQAAQRGSWRRPRYSKPSPCGPIPLRTGGGAPVHFSLLVWRMAEILPPKPCGSSRVQAGGGALARFTILYPSSNRIPHSRHRQCAGTKSQFINWTCRPPHAGHSGTLRHSFSRRSASFIVVSRSNTAMVAPSNWQMAAAPTRTPFRVPTRFQRVPAPRPVDHL